jgi:hypothetical protein
MSDQTQTPQPAPRTVQSAKLVDLAIVSYTDHEGQSHSQLFVVGEKTAIMLDGRTLGYSTRPEPAGIAGRWLRDEILKALKKEVPTEG